MKIFTLKRFALTLLTLMGVFSVQTLGFAKLPDPNDLITPQLPYTPVAPQLSVVTAVPAITFDKTPSFTFHSSQAGKITYIGDCSSITTDAISGNNTITFNTLTLGSHNNCKLNVKGTSSALTSDNLNIAAFTINQILVIDVVAPSLSFVSGFTSPTDDTTPSIVFSSNEEGIISYEGACYSSSSSAVDGNNTVTFQEMNAGSTYSNCKIRVTDLSGNISDALSIPSFQISPASSTNCSGFIDISASDSDCDAITYVKGIGAMTGNPDGTFDPGALLQRDQIAKIALETFNNFNSVADYCSGANPFPDVLESNWAYQYICRAKNLSVVTGYLAGPDAGYYRPARSVNRVEFLAIILRNLSSAMPTGVSYSDVPSNAWYAGYAKYSKNNSLFTGTKLYPSDFTTRREVAQVIYKLHNLGEI